MMNNREERDLRNCPIFSEPEAGIWENRDNMPWPRTGDSLLSDRIGAEAYLFPYEDWIPDELERLSFFAMLYVERARDLVRLWLRSRDKPENFVYAVGFLYRHAIELELKATIARSAWFRAKSSREQREILWGHCLKELWETAKPLVKHLLGNDQIEPFEAQLLELDRLDERSDGFRYPFRFIDREGHRQSLLGGLRFKSFDNFVWILEGLSTWVTSLQDEEERHREHEAELARDAGW